MDVVYKLSGITEKNKNRGTSGDNKLYLNSSFTFIYTTSIQGSHLQKFSLNSLPASQSPQNFFVKCIYSFYAICSYRGVELSLMWIKGEAIDNSAYFRGVNYALHGYSLKKNMWEQAWGRLFPVGMNQLLIVLILQGVN